MNFFKSTKVFNAIPPGVIRDDAPFVSRVIDTAIAGAAKSLVFAVALGSIDADLTTFKVVQSDVETDATTLGGDPADLLDVIASVTPGATDDDQVVLVEIDLQGPHKRYMQLQATAGNGAAGTYLSALAFLTNAGVPPANSNALAYVEG